MHRTMRRTDDSGNLTQGKSNGLEIGVAFRETKSAPQPQPKRGGLTSPRMCRGSNDCSVFQVCERGNMGMTRACALSQCGYPSPRVCMLPLSHLPPAIPARSVVRVLLTWCGAVVRAVDTFGIIEYSQRRMG